MDGRLHTQMHEQAANYGERLAEVCELQERARQVTARARSHDGLVSVEVGAQGQLRDLWLDPGACDRLSAQRLAATVMQVATDAAADAAAQVRVIMGPVLPAADDLARAMPPTLSMLGSGPQ